MISAAFNASEDAPDASRTLGVLLVDSKRMTPEAAETVLRHQRQNGGAFGAVAVRLGLATQDDIDFALARQFEYPYLAADGQVGSSVVAAYDPFSPQVEALRSLRTQLLLRLQSDVMPCVRLAIVSASAGDGRSYLAANLAVVFSQLGEKTLLVDADLRGAAQHTLFSADNRFGLSTLLAGRPGGNAIQRVPGLVDLSILTAGPKPPNPQELLGRPLFPQFLDDVAKDYDVVIVDTPGLDRHAEALTIAQRTGAALVVARKDATRMADLRTMTRSMENARITVVGAVVNEY